MKRSRKQAKREAMTAEAVRLRTTQKLMAADREWWIAQHGTTGWQAELDRRRRARNERTRAHTAAVVAAKQLLATDDVQPGLWEAA